MKWFCRTAVGAFVLTSAALGIPAPDAAYAVPGVEADLGNPLRPHVHVTVGSDDLGAEATVVSDYMTLGFGADATGKALGHKASATFNRRGDMLRVCAPSEHTCVRR